MGMHRSRIYVLFALFYPVTLLLVFGGLLAFLLIVFGVDVRWVAAAILPFFSIGLTGIVLIGARAFKKFGYFKEFCLALAAMWILTGLYLSLLLLFNTP